MDLKDAIEPRPIEVQWRWERIGWALIALVVLAAALGLFGGGPLSRETLTVHDGNATFEVEYERFNRLNHVSVLVVRVTAPGAGGEDLNVTLNRDMAEDSTIRSSAPSAEGALSANGIVYSFPVEDWAQPLTVSFEYLPETAGYVMTVATIAAGDRSPVRIDLPQFIYP